MITKIFVDTRRNLQANRTILNAKCDPCDPWDPADGGIQVGTYIPMVVSIAAIVLYSIRSQAAIIKVERRRELEVCKRSL
jgi:hypothetical protein